MKRSQHLYESHIVKVLKEISIADISLEAKSQLNNILVHLSRIIGEKAFLLTEIARKRTISRKELKNSIQLLFIGDLGKNAIKEGESIQIRSGDGKMSRQNRSGIIFPPSIAEQFLRRFGMLVGKEVPFYMAVALEYITAEILELASQYTLSAERKRITIRDLEMVIREDEELSDFFVKLNMNFSGGGIVPFIHPELLVKRNRKRESKEGKEYKYKPGTVALRNIRKLQRQGGLLLAKKPFEIIVRELVNELVEEGQLKISKIVFLVLQYYIEQEIIKLLQTANNLAIYTGRLRLIPSDIEMVISIQEKRFPKFFLNTNDEIELFPTIEYSPAIVGVNSMDDDVGQLII